MPLVSRTFDQLISFTRTSSATFVGSNGLVQNTPASVNLLTFTQEFDNGVWAKVATTATANTTVAPDTTSTADTITAAAATSAHTIAQSGGGSGAALTMSVYAKAGTSSFLQLFHGSASTIFANFNLSTGVVGTVGAGATAAISAVGDGWYRCAITFTPGSASATRVAIVTSGTAVHNESWTATGTETIFLWGAQLELGSTATTYTRNFGGLYPPRLDYDPATLLPRGLLIEEQRTNLVTYSEDFANAAWGKVRSSISANVTVAPDGTNNADKLVETATTGVHEISQAGGVTSGTTYVYSVFAKQGERNRLRIQMDAGRFPGTALAFFDLVTGAPFDVGAGATALMTNCGNGWFRCILVSTATVSGAASTYSALVSTGTTFSYTGDGTSGLYLYGAQFEAGAFATSYIPTVASQVTRTSDQPTILAPMFAPWYNQSEGTIFVEATAYGGTNSNRYYEFNDGTGSNLIQGFAGPSTINTGWVDVDGVGQARLSTSGSPTALTKMAAAVKLNDFAASLNGAAPATDISGALPTVNRLGIGNNPTGSSALNGHIRSIRYYPTRLNDAQLQALTA